MKAATESYLSMLSTKVFLFIKNVYVLNTTQNLTLVASDALTQVDPSQTTINLLSQRNTNETVTCSNATIICKTIY